MSDGPKIPLAQARTIAEQILLFLSPYCDRIEIAGSIRRQKPMVGDVELVAIPKPVTDMFGQPEPMETDHALNGVDWSVIGEPVKNGSKMKQIRLHSGISLDLFIVTPPAQWGVIYLIRTGPPDYSHRLVTSRQQRGLMPSCFHCEGGAVRKGNVILPTPEESDVYKLLGLP